MIKSFAHAETEKLWLGRPSRRFPPDIQQRALTKLQLIDAAVELSFLRLPPGNRLEALKGKRAGQHSIRINDQWRSALCGAGPMPSRSRSSTITDPPFPSTLQP